MDEGGKVSLWTVYWADELCDLWSDMEVLETMKSIRPVRIVHETRLIEF
jgi:hypothetical protein